MKDPEPPRVSFRENPLEATLGIVAEVRPGEGLTALVLAANVFLLLTSYYLLKVAREPLILMGGGAEVKSYAAAGQSVLLIGVAAAYGELAKRVDRAKLIIAVSLFFASNLLLFAFLGWRGVPLGIPFYLWVGIFSLTVIAQFWSFAADLYREEQGKRLFPILGLGSSIGAVAGAAIAGRLVKLGPFGLMLVAAAILVGCLGLTIYVDRRERARGERDHAPAQEPIGGKSGFAMLLEDRYLLLIGALAFIINAVNSTGEYVLDRTLLAAAATEAAKAQQTTSEFVGAFKADYFAYVNAIGVTLQLFVVSRVIKYVGVRAALFIMPIVSGFGYATMAIAPILGLVFVAKVAENSLDYSLQNTARQALWLGVSRQAKYKVKQIVDSFLVRAGDVVSAGLVLVGTHLAFQTVHFAIANLVLIACWMMVLVFLGRAHKQRDDARPVLDG